MHSHKVKGWLCRMAVALLAAVILCLTISATALPANGGDDKARRATKAVRDGDYETAEKLFREVARERHS